LRVSTESYDRDAPAPSGGVCFWGKSSSSFFVGKPRDDDECPEKLSSPPAAADVAFAGTTHLVEDEGHGMAVHDLGVSEDPEAQGHAVGGVDGCHDPANVFPDGDFGDVEPDGDFLVAVGFEQERQHLAFAG
jgi:hypothetical protein